MKIELPQIMYFALMFMSFGIHVTRHGETREQKYNAWAAMISIGITIFILWAGGFFTY